MATKIDDLSKEAREKLTELIEKYDPINNRNLNPSRSGSQDARDARLPIPGTTIHRKYKGKPHMVRVLKDGFEYEQKRYASLTAVAKHITGTHWSGYEFFGLKK